jgi:hypothetical protein
MPKTVATYSWLMRKAMALHKKDPEAYHNLMNSGTTKLLPGAEVRLFGHDHYTHQFSIRVNGKRWCEIFGIRWQGKFYSYYQPLFTVTQYRKRLVEKYMPFSLPDGVRSRTNSLGGQTKCIFHNADGSVAGDGLWFGGRRSKPGNPSRPLVICDDTGEFTAPHLHLEENYESLMCMGWFPESSRNRKDWLESVGQMPYCDTGKVKEIAAKAYLAAARLCEKNPGMRMALFPAAPCPNGESIREQWHHHPGQVCVLQRDSFGTPTMWYLPEVLVYWEEEGKGFITLSMTIPPHGCESLDPAGKSGQLSRHVRYKVDNDSIWNRLPLPEAYEQAYHAIPAYAPGTPADERRIFSVCSSHYSYGGPHNTSREKYMAVWPRHANKVRVKVASALVPFGDVPLPLPMDIPLAMKPEEVLLAFEEKFLLESLPLC